MYLFLVITVAMSSLLHAADDGKITEKLKRSFDLCTTIQTYVPCNIDCASQIKLPVDSGRTILVPLDSKNPFSNESLRAFIKQTGKSDLFFILASYRCKEAGGVSYPRYAEGVSLITGQEGMGNIDLFTKLPIIKADYHELFYSNGHLVTRYLGNLKTLKPNDKEDHDNILSLITLRSKNLREAYAILSNLHALKGDILRSKKYMNTVVPDYSNLSNRLNSSLKKGKIETAKKELLCLLNMSCKNEGPLLSDDKLINYICTLCNKNDKYSDLLTDALYGHQESAVTLGHICFSKQFENSNHEKDCYWARLGLTLFQQAALTDGVVENVFPFLNGLSIFKEKDHPSWCESEVLTKYSDICLKAIDQKSDTYIENLRKRNLNQFERVLKLIQKHCSKQK